MKVEESNYQNIEMENSDLILLSEIALLQGMAVESNWKNTIVEPVTDAVEFEEITRDKLRTRKKFEDEYFTGEPAISRKKSRSRSYRICSKCGHWKDIGYFAQYHYGEDMTPISCAAPESCQKVAYSGWCGCSICVTTNEIYNVERPLHIRKQSKRGKGGKTQVFTKTNINTVSDRDISRNRNHVITPTTSIEEYTDTEQSSNTDNTECLD